MAESKLTDEARVKIKEVAALDGTVEEMAYYSGVSRQTVYNWFKEEPDLLDEVTRLRERPILKARQTIVKGLEQPENARWYLERKKKLEFAQRAEHTGAEGKDLQINVISFDANNNPPSVPS